MNTLKKIDPRDNLYNKKSINALNNHFQKACEDGDIELVKYLLTSPKLYNKAEINCNRSWALVLACAFGHLDVVSFLLTSSELKYHASIHGLDGEPLKYACINGHIDIVKYLLTSDELHEKSSIRYKYNDVINDACKYGHLDILIYLLEMKTLKNKDIKYYPKDNDFIIAIESKQIEIIKFLIIDYDFPINTKIMSYLKDKKCHEVLDIISRKKLKDALDKDLEMMPRSEHKNKI